MAKPLNSNDPFERHEALEEALRTALRYLKFFNPYLIGPKTGDEISAFKREAQKILEQPLQTNQEAS